ncbi:MAG: hypothetical protein CL920_19060 [Deltaproteobacteria bacterium]|nr:hypothetical protein [Deltaproteobacteria bacterium]MBU50786.1 hypothetical protein [Deltaproteobacteria bacterium]|tara:strand:+ start:5413 stop:6114 length:702 start_codon:yes stop_codon:yes gene_type:complete
MDRLIQAKRSVIPACDITLDAYEELVKQTADLPMVSAYKIGFSLGLGAGLPKVVEVTRRYTEKPLIYDHQKAATDIPATGKVFAKTLKDSGVEAVILFPQAGPATQRAWIEAMREYDLSLMVGGHMTHAQYKQSDGGYLTDEGILQIYRLAAEMNVQDYVVPGNRPDVIAYIRKEIESFGIQPRFYAPGFLSQGGSLEAADEVAGEHWHAIIGRAITQAANPRDAILELWPFA